MLHILFYYHRYYQRSYRYVAPLTLYLIAVFFLYGVVPNPVMDSYAITSTFLFFVSAWFCYGFIDIEDETQQIITFLHSRKLTLLYALKLLYIWLFTLPISTFAIIYPIIFDKFDYTPSFQQALIAFSCHQLSALLGISIAVWFNQKLFRTTRLSFFGLCTILSISLGGQGIIDQTTPIISWIIPPYRIILFILSDDNKTNNVLTPIEIASPVIYITILILSFLLVMKNRKFENSNK
ncbi:MULTISPECIES: hypothetical protein [Paenibacillus]|uniref:ABC transporter permease n=1 Tax=Paenibacillus cucumis (ex Kampfer et al. 2016) TaxID=1776858 RepID=A0ABS7KSI3_9BACL|nr:hypothetical protein [Paenibacillus cucumis (ex Kampfer et al. 2016)]MBY0207123.1 hypothetical protein [Paenibacillus cucumis (ex Kampfer et al. 2016)]MDP9698976.1 hypothetical protein [Paenibacillus intestini]